MLNEMVPYVGIITCLSLVVIVIMGVRAWEQIGLYSIVSCLNTLTYKLLAMQSLLIATYTGLDWAGC